MKFLDPKEVRVYRQQIKADLQQCENNIKDQIKDAGKALGLEFVSLTYTIYMAIRVT